MPKSLLKSKPWFSIRNQAESSQVEILIYDQIGKDWFSDDGINAKDFDAALKAIASDKQILVRINSPGGNVWDGMAIYNMLKSRGSMVTCQVDGIAASIASVIACAGATLRIPSNAMFMVHEPSALIAGDSEEMRKMADMLDQHAEIIANVYADKCGKSMEEMRALMRDETWLNGDQCKEMGLADEVSAEVAMAASVKNFDLSNYRRMPESIRSSNSKPSPAKRGEANSRNIMNRAELIALLKEHGVTVNDDISDVDLLAKLKETLKNRAADPAQPATPAPISKPDSTQPSDIIDLRNELKSIREAREQERESRLRNEITALANEGRCPLNSVDGWVKLAIQNETGVMAQLRAMPPSKPGEEPISAVIINEDPRTIEKAVLNLFGKQIHEPAVARERARARASIISDNFNRLMPILNTNTVSSDLKRTVILQQMIRAFAIKVLPLTAFSTRLDGIRLEGTDKVAVPYFALNTTSSTAFVAANGYDTFSNTNSDAKTVTIDKRQYQALKWSSSELARQPYLDVAMGAALLAEQLGLDVVNDVLSLVTAASFGASVKAEPAAAFDFDDVADLKGTADLANWPGMGRSLILNSAYDVNLLKDVRVSNAQSWGDNAPIREGRIVRIGGFDYFPDARVPANAENLEGFIVWKSALLVGFSPIGPTAEVRNLLSRYEVVIEPTTGATFEYRLWGDPDLDTTKEVIEVNYGKDEGELTALKRITNQ